MHKRESGKVSKNLEQFKLCFDHGVWIWSKFELNEIWKFWTMETICFGGIGCVYYQIDGVIFVGAKKKGRI